ncbi:MAG: ABC-F family ATP-binding cassette domain-containing protein [Lachnospiraceae bacterium]|nr:ABC-F family ATP-binding cassette domain-containing protein [Lachnospiraceae bacterium]
MILGCTKISKSFGTDVVLTDVSFHINEREKAAIIGVNGAGKTTLLRIIMGEEPADTGSVIFANDASVGYLAQHQDLTSEKTIYEELLTVKEDVTELDRKMRALEEEMKHLSGDALEQALESYTRYNHAFEQKNGYAYKSELTGVLKGLGFAEDEFDKQICNLSGGQKTRVFLGKLLLTKPDLILLDEPTNHLDMNSIAWLETYLKNYPGAVVIVSHDRYFLDRVVTKVIEIERTQARVYEGNYTAYSQKKEQLRSALIAQYKNQQREIKHQEEVIAKLKSFNREKSIKRAESREKMLSKIEVLDKPVFDDAHIHLRLEPQITSGNDVLSVKGLAKSFGENHLFSGVSFEVKRGDRVAIIGNNGTGKTTLLKILNDLEEADAGEIRLGAKVHIGYYDQEMQVLHMEKTLFEEISDADPDLDNTRIRNVLASFLFTGDDVFKRIGDLSGGERGRVSLAKLMLSESNFIILDEPTNHLDISSKEILESALNHYTGTILYVSHDRFFINRTATRILDLTHEQLVAYTGNYDYYLEKKEETEARLFGTGAFTAAKEATESKLDWQKKKELQSQIRRLQAKSERLQKELETLENRIAEIDEDLTKEEVFTDPDKLIALQEERTEAESKTEELMEAWEETEEALGELV